MTPKPQELPKLYSMFSIGLVTFLFSLLAGGCLLCANYIALGMHKMALRVLAASAVAYFSLSWALSTYVGVTSNTTEEQLTLSVKFAFVTAVGQAIVAIAATQFLQGPMFATFQEMRGRYQSAWRAFFIGLCVALAMIIIASLWIR